MFDKAKAEGKLQKRRMWPFGSAFSKGTIMFIHLSSCSKCFSRTGGKDNIDHYAHNRNIAVLQWPYVASQQHTCCLCSSGSRTCTLPSAFAESDWFHQWQCAQLNSSLRQSTQCGTHFKMGSDAAHTPSGSPGWRLLIASLSPQPVFIWRLALCLKWQLPVWARVTPYWTGKCQSAHFTRCGAVLSRL